MATSSGRWTFRREQKLSDAEDVLDCDYFRRIASDDLAHPFADLHQPNFQCLSRKQSNRTAAAVMQSALVVLLDYTEAGVLATAIYAENSHVLAPSLAG
jgi:hypothetical protein